MRSTGLQYKLAHIHDPTYGVMREVTVIEDSACKANFVHPMVVKHCHLQEHPAKPIKHKMMTGDFQSDKEVELSWIGHDNKNGTIWAYVAPEDAPEQLGLLVGTHFMSENPNAFGVRALLEPALLNVQSQMQVSLARKLGHPAVLQTHC